MFHSCFQETIADVRDTRKQLSHTKSYQRMLLSFLHGPCTIAVQTELQYLRRTNTICYCRVDVLQKN